MNTFQKVYRMVSVVPTGKVTTYGEIAKKLGMNNPRVVGYALHVNPDPDNIPCHRVVNAHGEMAGGFAFGGRDTQMKLLKAEGVRFEDNKVLLDKYLFRFK
jgi:methylated-DNA-protein-cysteine methyltransferase-like protein